MSEEKAIKASIKASVNARIGFHPAFIQPSKDFYIFPIPNDDTFLKIGNDTVGYN
jgi:hypothetical protein